MLRPPSGGASSGDTAASLCLRWNRIALFAYPRAFREAYGRLLEQALRDMLRAELASDRQPECS